MKIAVITAEWDDDCRNSLEIQVDGKTKFNVHDGEPEDNTLCRNFNDCYSVADLMKLAHEAGARGETFEIEHKEEEE